MTLGQIAIVQTADFFAQVKPIREEYNIVPSYEFNFDEKGIMIGVGNGESTYVVRRGDELNQRGRPGGVEQGKYMCSSRLARY